MGIDSLRAEITWFESARAYAAADGRNEVTTEDLQMVAPMALRLRRSQFMTDYLKGQLSEEKEMNSLLSNFGTRSEPKKRARRAQPASKKK
jgi:magnesium chelatase subunit I